MPTDLEPHFQCEDCGERIPAHLVDYDSLGYAVCPACEAPSRPAPTA